ncbi:DUF2779 domain-containing protein [Flavobacterium sp.]|jgi:hypothetical protein|uniref:DUF2779 domain-containing protein n=1 Tax=Flavobacterium sp. TaxID=239 RepID=UPI0037C18092
MVKVISKSRFVSGIQCSKKLYFDIYRKDLKPEISEQQELLFSTGHEIGELAQSAFPNGKDASPENYYDFSKSIQDTKDWIDSDLKTIYEAAFSSNGVLAALDILHHTENERWAIEVKSSSEVKKYHLTDASLQYWVMNKSGFKPDKFFLMHINTAYIKDGDINPKELFTLADITNEVIGNQLWVEENLENLKNILSTEIEPVVEIGKHCGSPFECDYKHHCWKHIPEQSVFSLYNPRGLDWKLYEQGIFKIIDIPETVSLNHRQNLQVSGQKIAHSHIDKTSISEFLSNWEFPLYFFDFETIFPALPVLNGTRPFQQVPFQYSLHILEQCGDNYTHKEFLAEPKDFNEISIDPRKKLIEQMKLDFGEIGSIVAYNATFEISRLKELAIAFPEDRDFIENIINRFVDLLIPFRNAWFYHPEMGGSASIKAVLPAIAPEFNYKDLEISNGGDASNIFLRMINNKFIGDEIFTRESLKKYCERDTLGMVIIWEELIKHIK